MTTYSIGRVGRQYPRLVGRLARLQRLDAHSEYAPETIARLLGADLSELSELIRAGALCVYDSSVVPASRAQADLLRPVGRRPVDEKHRVRRSQERARS